MAKVMKTVKGPRKLVMKRPARKAAMPSSSCKQKSSAAPTKETLWSPIKVSSSFVPLFEMQRRREFLKGDIERKERQLNTTRYELNTVERQLKRWYELIEEAGKPTGKVLNVSVQRGTSQLQVSCQFLSGNLAFAVNLPFYAMVGDLQSHVHRKHAWAASACIDHESKVIPSHAGLQGRDQLIMKEVELKEVSSQDQLTFSRRWSDAIDFLKKVKLPIRYEQKEDWEDEQGVGFIGRKIKLEFRASKSKGVLKFGRLVDLQDIAGRRRCDELIRSPKYQGSYKAPYAPSRIEAVNSEVRLNKILTDLAEEVEAFAGADWDSVTECWRGDSLSAAAEVKRRQEESRNVINAALAWIEKFCRSGVLSAVYVRLEHGEPTFHDCDSPADQGFSWGSPADQDSSVNSEKPGRSIAEGTGLLFIKAESGEIARLSLEKRTEAWRWTACRH